MSMFLQTDAWAQLNQHYNDFQPIRINESGISCLFHINHKDSVLSSYEGPVFPDTCSEKDLNAFLSKIFSLAKQRNLRSITLRYLSPLSYRPAFLETTLTKKWFFEKEELRTFLVDLYRDDGELFMSFKQAARKGIKKAVREGIKVEKCSTFNQFYEQYMLKMLAIKGHQIKTRDFYKKYWDIDVNNNYTYWVAVDKFGQTLGFLGSYFYESIASEIHSAITPIALESKLPVQDLLHWEAFICHKGLGHRYFDLAGYNPFPLSEKEKNIKRFKEKWGGSDHDCSSFIFRKRNPVIKYLKGLIKS